MTISRANIDRLLQIGIGAIVSNGESYPDEYKQLFKTETSDKAWEEEIDLNELGSASIKNEGNAFAQGSMSVGNSTIYKHKTYGISFQITHEALNDNQYTKQFPRYIQSLNKSLRDVKNQVAANVLNLGAVINTSDGVPFFSQVHPLVNGETCSNLSNVALSEVGLQAAIIGIGKFKQSNGMFANEKAQQLVVGIENQFAASVLLGSQYKASVGTVNNNAFAGVNDINAIYNDSYIPKGFTVNHYITSPTFCAITTGADRGLIHYQREKISANSWEDPATKSVWFAGWERYSFGVTNWRSAFAINI